MKRLNQVIAIEKGVKSRVYGDLTEVNKQVQKSDLFDGFVKVFEPTVEDAESLPTEEKRVQLVVPEVLKSTLTKLTELFDVTATKDYANCRAFGDVVVDGDVLLEKVPATYLLFLEKQLTDMRTFVSNMPTLDLIEDWMKDPNSDLFKSKEKKVHRTRKVQRGIVLYDATKEHPAQTQLITEDVVIGYYNTVRHSGAMPLPEKQVLAERVESLLKAVKSAREEANMVEVEEVKVGDKIKKFLIGQA